jgi:hypothetical protein
MASIDVIAIIAQFASKNARRSLAAALDDARCAAIPTLAIPRDIVVVERIVDAARARLRMMTARQHGRVEDCAATVAYLRSIHETRAFRADAAIQCAGCAAYILRNHPHDCDGIEPRNPPEDTTDALGLPVEACYAVADDDICDWKCALCAIIARGYALFTVQDVRTDTVAMCEPALIGAAFVGDSAFIVRSFRSAYEIAEASRTRVYCSQTARSTVRSKTWECLCRRECPDDDLVDKICDKLSKECGQ